MGRMIFCPQCGSSYPLLSFLFDYPRDVADVNRLSHTEVVKESFPWTSKEASKWWDATGWVVPPYRSPFQFSKCPRCHPMTIGSKVVVRPTILWQDRAYAHL